jgi:hypothetical protein
MTTLRLTHDEKGWALWSAEVELDDSHTHGGRRIFSDKACEVRGIEVCSHLAELILGREVAADVSTRDLMFQQLIEVNKKAIAP